jgi:uncharacterized membrane protein YjfL (UPF0719 family)
VGLGLELMPVMLGIGHVVLGVLALIVAKFAKGVLSPYRTDEELTARDNPAFGLVLAGYYGAVVTIYIGVARALPLDAGSAEVAVALASNLAWTVGGIIALNLSRSVMNSLLVSGARCSDEVVKNRNTAAGAVECGLYVASGIVLAGALREPGGTWLTAIVFFVLSQLVLLVLGRVYQRFAGYGIAKEICGGNLAAGVAFGLTLVALSLLMLKATSAALADRSRAAAQRPHRRGDCARPQRQRRIGGRHDCGGCVAADSVRVLSYALRRLCQSFSGPNND